MALMLFIAGWKRIVRRLDRDLVSDPSFLVLSLQFNATCPCDKLKYLDQITCDHYVHAVELGDPFLT